MALNEEQKREMAKYMEEYFSTQMSPWDRDNSGRRSPGLSAAQQIAEMMSTFRPLGGQQGSVGMAPQGYLNMPGMVYPTDTSRVDKIPAIMEGIGGTVRTLAALSALVGKGRKEGWGSLLEGFNFGGFGGGGGG